MTDPTVLRACADLTPTRNRGLDLLPLPEHMHPAALSERVDAAMLKGGRPTCHYRLPEACLSAPGWSAVYEWTRWKKALSVGCLRMPRAADGVDRPRESDYAAAHAEHHSP